MRRVSPNITLFVARMALSLLFIDSGLGKFADLQGLAGALGEKGLPLPGLAAPLAALFELLAGLSLLVGLAPVPVSLVLAAFTLVATVLFHDFWAVSGAAFEAEKIHALKNLGLIGGFLALSISGGGGFSLQERLRWSGSAESGGAA